MRPKSTQVTCGMSQEFEFHQKYSSTPWRGAVDQDWRSKMHALKCASRPPDGSALALLSVPNQSGKGAINPR